MDVNGYKSKVKLKRSWIHYKIKFMVKKGLERANK